MKLQLLPLLAALALAGNAASGSASPTPSPRTTTTTQTIYAGSLQNNWQSLGWANMNLENPSPALSSDSIKVQAGPGQAVDLQHAPLRTMPLMYVSFWINGGTSGGQSLVVRALRNGTPQLAVPVGSVKPNLWQHVQIALPRLGVGTVSDFTGFWIQNSTLSTLPAFYLDKISLSSAGAPQPPAPPAAPTGLTATPQWVQSCPACGGMAMAHIILNWSAVSGASSYTVYRDGVKQVSQAAPGWTDMNVVSGTAYSYAVSATSNSGESGYSAAVSAVAPQPPDGATPPVTAPVNLSVRGIWAGSPTDTLSWLPVPGAVSYNVYQYETKIVHNLSSTSCLVPPAIWWNGLTYTVTAVDATGMESLPSAPVTAQGGLDPAQSPVWSPDSPAAPWGLIAVPEWNAGRPRIHLTWHGSSTDDTYTLYRDGQPLQTGLWGLSGYDVSVSSGETHSYSVTGSNVIWTQSAESAACAPVMSSALPSPPIASGTPLQITSIEPNDDSALISFAAVPGAADYRVYDITKPTTVKYSGGGLSIEMNGLDPAGADLVVEAVDKLGPFQTMDGMAGPGAMQMDGMHSAINGQGDPSDLPNVLAVSVPTHITLTPRSLTGGQVFFDTFRSEQPLTLQPLPTTPYAEFYGRAGQYAEYGNAKWAIRNYGGDITDSAVFFMGSHFMDTLYDGGTPRTGDPMHNDNASLVMMPKATADISGGKVLHVTLEVDPHMDSRRWCDVFVAPAGDTLVDPGKFADFPNRRPTMSGQLFRWDIQAGVHALDLFRGIQPDAQSDIVHLTDQANGVGPDDFGLCARSGPWCAVPFNGTMHDLDKRHKFDLYLSQNRTVIMEQGQVVKDKTFPAGVILPFDHCQVYLVHQLYHTGNDRPELLNYDPADTYWINNRSWADERHWDNCGQEVLDAFPALP